jgi:hypothetical protein
VRERGVKGRERRGVGRRAESSEKGEVEGWKARDESCQDVWCRQGQCKGWEMGCFVWREAEGCDGWVECCECCREGFAAVVDLCEELCCGCGRDERRLSC